MQIKNVLYLYLGCDINRAGRIERLDYNLLVYTETNNLWEATKPLLRPFESITDEEWQEAWGVIGGAPHLYEFGIDDLKKALQSGEFDDSGIQMDYFTMSQLINYFRNNKIDCDDLINSGLAIDKTK